MLDPSWSAVLRQELQTPSFEELQRFVEGERAGCEVMPPIDRQFAAFASCKFDEVSVVILGQDPYPTPGHANGLAFSVPRHVSPVPGSLRNIYKELHHDLGVPPAPHGDLQAWADQGVLLLNSVLTTRAGEPASHAGQGWERFTDGAISALSDKRTGLVFMLWGAYAQRKVSLIDHSSHLVLRSAHPSPLSASRGFFGSAPFSAANRYLKAQGMRPIDWAAHLQEGQQAAGDASVLPSPGAGPARMTAPRATPQAVPHAAPQAAPQAALHVPLVETKPQPAAPPQPASPPQPAADPQPASPPQTASPPQPASTSQPGAPSAPAVASEVVAGAAPHQWWKQMTAIERARSARNAPVDFLGCHTLGEPADGPEAWRFQTLIALILSPRTQDATVAQAMVRLRTLAGPLDEAGQGRITASAVAGLDEELILRAILGVTYSKQKASRVLQTAQICTEEYAGDVPRDLKAVLRLPGVGPKVGHLLMQVGWGETLGIAVDTHVHRIAARLGWTRGAKNAEATRKQLEAWLPREQWQQLNPLLVGFGQQVCAENPNCRRCRLSAERLCPQIGVQ